MVQETVDKWMKPRVWGVTLEELESTPGVIPCGGFGGTAARDRTAVTEIDL